MSNGVGHLPLLAILTAPLVLMISDSLEVFATHISKPVPYLEKNEFYSNETIDLSGWVEYNREPASDVLVQVFLEKERDKLTSDNFTSDSNGNFSAILSLPDNVEPGNYTVSVTSLCQEIHGNVCTYQWEELPITISTRNN
ncbi:hypothetical protein [Candidatus Nitrosocosmicus sp. T]